MNDSKFVGYKLANTFFLGYYISDTRIKTAREEYRKE